ncbi:hypothetical protein SAMN05216327_117113 [Dyadobacter sp. SG02]|uniref:DUF3575 domain-containing protein n=1 Tax=Dyadobacter sp. SG02 TaxID=1855291 RepID=UPI0008AC1EB2|nr:DUF3575 domain-containing protein [Dyadobacter sp. SG02]SEJ72839.1 hypothetical protein SAMN05216327_117113 [Dyadobacter sp. SG02]
MRSTLFIFFVLLCTLGNSFAQPFDVETTKRHVIIKYSPAAMFDFDNTIQFGVEIPLGKGNFALQQDLGYGPSRMSSWQNDDNDVDKQTFKSRTHLRWYFMEKRRMRAYVGPEFLFKKVVLRESQWIGKDCSGPWGPCSFFQNQDVRIDKNVVAGHARFGWQFIKSNRFVFDVFTGIGFRHIFNTSHSPGVPDYEVRGIDDVWEFLRPNESDLRPSAVMGFHLGIILGKYRRD